MANDSEVEFKLAIRPADTAAFRRIALLREKGVDGPVLQKLFNVYFDTPGLVLKQHAMALRLRNAGGKWLQTLKTAGVSTGGLHQRAEWEYPLRAPQLDLALFRETPLATLAQSKALHLTLKPAFTTEFQRTTWLVEIAPGQQVEVALDQGVIRCGDKEAPISEVEIELVKGDVAAVFAVAQALAEESALQPAILSKAERGYRLFHPEPLVARRAGDIELEREWSPARAMQAIAAACLDHFEANVEGALASDDPEYFHQLRVALRRLRSAIRIFKPAHAEPIAGELKRLTAALGAARDWDVLVTQTLPVLADALGDPALGRSLMAAAGRRRADARANARAALLSVRHVMLVIAVGHWVNSPGELALLPSRDANADVAPPAIRTLRGFASREIRHRQRRLLRDRRPLADLPVGARHQVRIDAKRLRYAADFFSSLFDRKRVAKYVNVLGEIQDLLGETNDDAIALHLIESLAPPPRLSEYAESSFAARTTSRLTDADRRMAALRNARHFWPDEKKKKRHRNR